MNNSELAGVFKALASDTPDESIAVLFDVMRTAAVREFYHNAYVLFEPEEKLYVNAKMQVALDAAFEAAAEHLRNSTID